MSPKVAAEIRINGAVVEQSDGIHSYSMCQAAAWKAFSAASLVRLIAEPIRALL
jgi:hypothetical protein